MIADKYTHVKTIKSLNVISIFILTAKSILCPLGMLSPCSDYHYSTGEVLIDWDNCSVTVLATRTGCGGCVIAASCPIVRDECKTAVISLSAIKSLF